MKTEDTNAAPAPPSPGRFAYDGLDRVMHERARLGILTSLVSHPDGLLFGDLKSLCGLTDGNLNRHLTALESAGLIEVWKRGAGRASRTLCRLTGPGRKRFAAYLGELERVLADAAPPAAAADAKSGPPAADRPLGWAAG